MGKANSKRVRLGGNVRAVLDKMEPDLRLLEGTVVVLRSLAETSDSIEPIALEALGTFIRRDIAADYRVLAGGDGRHT